MEQQETIDATCQVCNADFKCRLNKVRIGADGWVKVPIDMYYIITQDKKIECVYACLKCEQEHSLGTMDAQIMTYLLKGFRNMANEKGHDEIAESIDRLIKTDGAGRTPDAD